LKELTEAGLIDKAGDQRYQLTSIGADLRSALDPLDQWARRWAERPTSTR
jgi:DNA-binding HxlR family transcriptional regulator